MAATVWWANEKKKKSAFHAVRGGDVVGDHTVLFLGNGERIELVHRVTSRHAFASGAVAAAKWVVGQTRGTLRHAGRPGVGQGPMRAFSA
jgi:dihydrodipicolinate reductase